LAVFQSEWYELKQQGRLSDEAVIVPGLCSLCCWYPQTCSWLAMSPRPSRTDVYARNAQLDAQVRSLREQVQRANELAEYALLILPDASVFHALPVSSCPSPAKRVRSGRA